MDYPTTSNRRFSTSFDPPGRSARRIVTYYPQSSCPAYPFLQLKLKTAQSMARFFPGDHPAHLDSLLKRIFTISGLRTADTSTATRWTLSTSRFWSVRWTRLYLCRNGMPRNGLPARTKTRFVITVNSRPDPSSTPKTTELRSGCRAASMAHFLASRCASSEDAVWIGVNHRQRYSIHHR